MNYNLPGLTDSEKYALYLYSGKGYDYSEVYAETEISMQRLLELVKIDQKPNHLRVVK